MKMIKLTTATAFISMLLLSCTKYQEVKNASYSDQQVYMPAAVEGNSTNGIYLVNKVAVSGQVFRYTADVANKRINIPLGVYRSGATTKGDINVGISINADTANKMLSAGRFPAGTEVLSLGKASIPSSVIITDGADYASFDFSIDLDFLLANTTKKHAVGVSISSTGKTAYLYNTTILLIDPSFLVPVASFTTSVSSRTINFSNTSANAVTYSWDYGDGTPLSMAAASSHTYAASGTYTVMLTASGALGDYNKTTFTSSVVVP